MGTENKDAKNEETATENTTVSVEEWKKSGEVSGEVDELPAE